MLWITDCTSHLHSVHALLLRGLQTRWHVLDGGEDGLAAATPRVSAASLAASVPSVPLPASWVLTVSLLLEKRITLYTGGSWEISLCYEIEWVLNSFWKGFKRKNAFYPEKDMHTLHRENLSIHHACCHTKGNDHLQEYPFLLQQNKSVLSLMPL